MNFEYEMDQWPEPSDIHPFVENFSENESVFANHEIQYLKNNCESYPKISYQELDEFRDLMDDIDFNEIRENTKDKLDEYNDWTRESKKITKDNLFRKEWTKLYDTDRESGMYERKDKAGMFEKQRELEQINQLIKLEEKFRDNDE